MKKRLKTLFVFGTRPEAIKLAPVILSMRTDRRFLPAPSTATGRRNPFGDGKAAERIVRALGTWMAQ